MERLPQWLTSLVEPLEVSASSDADIHARFSWVDRWFFSLIEGPRLVHVQGNAETTPPDYALLWLTLSGINRPLGALSMLPRPGEMALLRWDEPASVISDHQFRYLIAHIPMHDIEQAVPDGCAIPWNRKVSAVSGPGAVLAAAIRTMASEAGHAEDREALTMLLQEIIHLMLRTFEAQIALPLQSKSPHNAVARVHSYIETHLGDENLCAAQVAQGCALSKRQLFRIFADQDESLADALRRMRIERACDLLVLHPTTSVEKVAHMTGFKSAAHFSRAFRRMVGETPSVYRQQQTAYRRDNAGVSL